MKLQLKSNVQLTNLQPQMVIALLAVLGVYESHDVYEVVITSANDSKHGVGSRHYQGNALDFRTKHIGRTQMPTNPNSIILKDRKLRLELIKEALVIALPGFDVLMEDINGPKEHLHIEYDPKYKPEAPQARRV